jgi:chemotaxis family two-component system response regulator Rcp1
MYVQGQKGQPQPRHRMPLAVTLPDLAGTSVAFLWSYQSNESTVVGAMPSTRRILLVEDNEAERYLFHRACAESRHPLVVYDACDGVEALDLLLHRNGFDDAPLPNLIVLDLNLPKLSGLEVLAAIKNEESLRSIPVVILSSSSAREDIQRSYDLKAAAFVTKPEGLDEFFRAVHSFEQFWFDTATLPAPAPKQRSAARMSG